MYYNMLGRNLENCYGGALFDIYGVDDLQRSCDAPWDLADENLWVWFCCTSRQQNHALLNLLVSALTTNQIASFCRIHARLPEKDRLSADTNVRSVLDFIGGVNRHLELGFRLSSAESEGLLAWIAAEQANVLPHVLTPILPIFSYINVLLHEAQEN